MTGGKDTIVSSRNIYHRVGNFAEETGKLLKANISMHAITLDQGDLW
jgi:hypothetical protein